MLMYIIISIVAFYAFLRYIYSYWTRKGFPYVEPTIPWGNMSPLIKREASFGITIHNLYKQTTDPFIGIYLFFRPALLIKDPELVKRILTVDFSHFHDRGVHSNEKTNPLSANLFSLTGEKWKKLRNKLTPTFTSGKLKKMFLTFEGIGDTMLEHLRETVPESGKTVELRALTTIYASDVIASTFFGLEVNTFKDPKNSFQRIREVMNSKSFLSTLSAATTFLCPKLFDLLQLHRINNPIVEVMVNLVGDTIRYREQNNLVRKDFMQMLLQLRNTGSVKEDGDWETGNTKDGNKSMTIEECAAQAFIFYIAGLETTAATTAYCLYEIANNDDVREKLLKDIHETLNKHDGQFTYDCIQDMKYLDLCILETLRKYPGLPILNRECTKSYQIPNSQFVVEEGTAIVISVIGLHRDPQLFPEPLKFIPERFQDGHRDFTEAAYIPFGDGPRTCIGLRQGKLSAKVAVVKILTSFALEAIETKEIEFEPFSVGLMAKGGANVRMKKL